MDRISILPEPIQNRIVSFLPLQDAIRTSVLSKAWKNLNSTRTIFDFHQPNFERLSRGKRDFKDFVYQTLVLHDGFDIEKFTLSVDLDELSVSHVNSWLSSVVSRNVKDVDLSVLYGQIEKLPCCLFTCKTLRVLALDNVNLQLPTNFGFPKLETLKLRSVNLIDENLTNQLFSSCPLLEELFISNCDLNNIHLLRICGPNLKFLTLLELYPTPDIEISASILHKITYNGYVPNITLETLTSLYSVDIQIFSGPTIIGVPKEVFYSRSSNILMGLQKVAEMALRGFFIEFLTRDRGSLVCLPTSCYSLERLHLDIFATKNQVQVIISLLRGYPNLKHLRISVQAQDTSIIRFNMDQYVQSHEMYNEGSLKDLKTVDILYFDGSESELDLVRYLLENAISMKRMDILCTNQMVEDALSLVSINERIGAFKKASPSGVISLS